MEVPSPSEDLRTEAPRLNRSFPEHGEAFQAEGMQYAKTQGQGEFSTWREGRKVKEGQQDCAGDKVAYGTDDQCSQGNGEL